MENHDHAVPGSTYRRRRRAKSKRKKSHLLKLVVILCIVGILVSGGYIAHGLWEYEVGAQTYQAVAQKYVRMPPANPQPSNGGTPVPAATRASSGLSSQADDSPQVDFGGLSAINPDIAAWLLCPDTAINYPVVQGKDNTYYLNHLFDTKRNASGTLFIDVRNHTGFEDRNTVIYGHNMKNGSMFKSLMQYKSQEYYNAHKVMYLLTPRGNYTLSLFAGYTASVEEDAWRRSFPDAGAYGDWISNAVSHSTFRADGIQVEASDCVVTLSTCDYTFRNARYVVVGKLERMAPEKP